jgi:hypothetical protein
MKTGGVFCAFLVLICVGYAIPAPLRKVPKQKTNKDRGFSSTLIDFEAGPPLLAEQASLESDGGNFIAGPAPTAAGIRELIPEKYQKRYQEWKEEFLSTEAGNQQWQTYAQSQGFILTITVARDNRHGGATGSYTWNESGKLVAATIVLGSELDAGYPNAVYYPVLHSLSLEATFKISGTTLAATKIAHEFGHVKQMMVTDPEVYRTQSRLIPTYNSIFLVNGHDTKDPRLTELVRRMGGTPVEIWQDREYWGETNAMLFLGERFAKNRCGCAVFRRIKSTVDLYARDYAERFEEVAQSASFAHSCGW